MRQGCGRRGDGAPQTVRTRQLPVPFPIGAAAVGERLCCVCLRQHQALLAFFIAYSGSPPPPSRLSG